MKCKLSKSELVGTISCPPNKSYTHRAIFLALLAKGTSTIRNVLFSRDTLATIEACKTLGAKIQTRDSSVIVESTGEISPSTQEIDASNSGTTIRISSALASLSEKTIKLTGDSSLKKRPMQPLLDSLEMLGAKCTSSSGTPPITVQGRIQGGNATISGSVSSQFVTALFLAAPKTELGIDLDIDGELVSKPYLDATIAIMKRFGVEVKVLSPYKKYSIKNQEYRPADLTVPADFSSAALLLAAAVLVGKDMTILAPSADLPQGDRAMLSFLKRMGVTVKDGDQIQVRSPSHLKGGKFDLSNNPDLLPPLAILALKTSDPIDIYNVRHARFKETDRIAILSRELSKIGLIITEKEDGLILKAPKILKGADFDAAGDHRLFMAFCIAGMFVGDCTVTDPESADVSYPTFINDMKKIGAKIE